ncbi:hypothetical protein D3C80_1322700 [compost metagenome]
MRIDRHASTTQCLNVALQAIMAQRHLFRPGDTANALMPQILEIVHGVKRGGQIINMDRRQFKLRCKFIRHHHRRQVALLFNAGIKRQTRPEQQHTVDLLGDDEVDKGFFLLILMRAIADQHQITLCGGRHFDAANDFTEERIANVRHNYQDGPRFVTLEVTAHRLR